MKTGAAFSRDRLYRYALWRTWDEDLPTVLFVGLNPSTADETADDPTIRRCIGFAKAWGFGGLCMANLFAYRATQPTILQQAPDPVGPDNDKWLMELASTARRVVCCWGNHGRFIGRGAVVRRLLDQSFCLGTNASGEPKHPLYVRAHAKLRRLK